MNEKMQNNKKERIPFGFDWIRIAAGIQVLVVLLVISLWSVNGTFAEKQAELIEDQKKDFGWIVLTVGYTVPLILGCAVPVVACIGNRKGEMRKHLIKGLIIAGAAVIVLGGVCPFAIGAKVKQRELSLHMEERADENPEFVIPESVPKSEDVTKELERLVEWTSRALLGLAVIGAYQFIRYKKLKDGDLDEEVPPDELCDDLPDVDWVEAPKKRKKPAEQQIAVAQAPAEQPVSAEQGEKAENS